MCLFRYVSEISGYIEVLFRSKTVLLHISGFLDLFAFMAIGVYLVYGGCLGRTDVNVIYLVENKNLYQELTASCAGWVEWLGPSTFDQKLLGLKPLSLLLLLLLSVGRER